ncbi:ferredoxin family protein [Candidatus Altiarchaeota archaeon]
MDYWRKPLDEDKAQKDITKGKINILENRCKGCRFCIDFCPNEVFVESKEYNKRGYHPPEIVDEEKCVLCHLCEYICPEFAIFVTEKKDRGKKNENR